MQAELEREVALADDSEDGSDDGGDDELGDDGPAANPDGPRRTRGGGIFHPIVMKFLINVMSMTKAELSNGDVEVILSEVSDFVREITVPGAMDGWEGKKIAPKLANTFFKALDTATGLDSCLNTSVKVPMCGVCGQLAIEAEHPYDVRVPSPGENYVLCGAFPHGPSVGGRRKPCGAVVGMNKTHRTYIPFVQYSVYESFKLLWGNLSRGERSLLIKYGGSCPEHDPIEPVVHVRDSAGHRKYWLETKNRILGKEGRLRENHLIIMLICGGDGYQINNHSQRSAVHMIYQPLALALSKRFSILFGVLGRTDPKGSFLTYTQRLAKALVDTEANPIEVSFGGKIFHVTLAFALLVGDRPFCDKATGVLSHASMHHHCWLCLHSAFPGADKAPPKAADAVQLAWMGQTDTAAGGSSATPAGLENDLKLPAPPEEPKVLASAVQLDDDDEDDNSDSSAINDDAAAAAVDHDDDDDDDDDNNPAAPAATQRQLLPWQRGRGANAVSKRDPFAYITRETRHFIRRSDRYTVRGCAFYYNWVGGRTNCVAIDAMHAVFGGVLKRVLRFVWSYVMALPDKETGVKSDYATTPQQRKQIVERFRLLQQRLPPAHAFKLPLDFFSTVCLTQGSKFRATAVQVGAAIDGSRVFSRMSTHMRMLFYSYLLVPLLCGLVHDDVFEAVCVIAR